jgi:type IV pilus assembly protein PilV
MRLKVCGFTLLESLIALLLLSVGLLGAGALLLAGLHAHGDALRRMAATRLAQDMADRIRANPGAGSLYDSRGRTPTDSCPAELGCDGAQRAAADLAHFQITARGLFPGVETPASIEFEPAIGPATPNRYSIRLRWRGPRDDAGMFDAVTLHVLAQPVAG